MRFGTFKRTSICDMKRAFHITAGSPLAWSNPHESLKRGRKHLHQQVMKGHMVSLHSFCSLGHMWITQPLNQQRHRRGRGGGGRRRGEDVCDVRIFLLQRKNRRMEVWVAYVCLCLTRGVSDWKPKNCSSFSLDWLQRVHVRFVKPWIIIFCANVLK